MPAYGRLATVTMTVHHCLSSHERQAMNTTVTYHHQPWNKGKLVGQKPPLRLKDIWSIRVRFQIADRPRDLALFELAIDSKLRARDLTKLRVRDIAHGELVSSRAIVMQQKLSTPCNLRSLSKHGRHWGAGYIKQAYTARISYFRAGCIAQIIFLPDNTLESSKSG